MKKLIILDIDETLIYATEVKLDFSPDFETEYYYIYKRPNVDEFIEFCFSNFDVAVWTTAGEDFANAVVETIFKERKTALKFLWSRGRCTPKFDPEFQEYSYIKNLSKVKRKGFSLEHVIMVDDTPAKLIKNYGNLVCVNEFTGGKNDIELLKLMKYLTYLRDVENIRKIEKRGWQGKSIT